MSRIKYTDIVNVTLDGKHVGVIKPVGDYFAYFPIGDRKGGKRYSSIEMVKVSLS